jgi:hypothetical protein
MRVSTGRYVGCLSLGILTLLEPLNEAPTLVVLRGDDAPVFDGTLNRGQKTVGDESSPASHMSRAYYEDAEHGNWTLVQYHKRAISAGSARFAGLQGPVCSSRVSATPQQCQVCL